MGNATIRDVAPVHVTGFSRECSTCCDMEKGSRLTLRRTGVALLGSGGTPRRGPHGAQPVRTAQAAALPAILPDPGAGCVQRQRVSAGDDRAADLPRPE